jgi:glycosyltransferase involved in cell wall biosynthesis
MNSEAPGRTRLCRPGYPGFRASVKPASGPAGILGSVRVLIFHGYLLRGTGSNIYNTSLARALKSLGHEVHLLCQDRDAAELEFVDAVGHWDTGELEVTVVREPVRCTVYLPPIGRVLPVYVADRYEGFDARPFAELGDDELAHYLERNVAAVRDVVRRVEPEAALANHLVMGPAILARALGGEVPFAIKIHGSALEYTVRPNQERFLPYAREGLDAAAGVLVGSRHTAESLWEVLADPALPERTRLGPPGVDIHAFRPRPAAEATARLRSLAERLDAGTAGWGGDHRAAEALTRLDPERERIVSYVGKLIVSKGVDLLLAAWPLVVAEAPDARLCVVGFGTYRDGLERMVAALGRADLAELEEVAARGRELEGGQQSRLTYLSAFLEGLAGERREDYLAAAPHAAERVHFTGRLEHHDLPDLLPSCLAQVVPSTFPESFGMVAAEAAACGALPLSASHSGLAEVTSLLREGLPQDVGALMSFSPGPKAVEEIAAKLLRWLELAPADRAEVRARLAAVARERFGWEHVAEGVLAAAAGRLDDLLEPPPQAWAPVPRSG